MLRDRRTRTDLAALLALVAGFYLPALGIGRYGDDYQFVSAGGVWQALTAPNPYNGFYRPLEGALYSLLQSWFGLSTAPVHLLIIAGHLALVCLVYAAALRLKLSRGAAIAASLYAGLSQTGVIAVASNDTLSQTLGVLFGGISLLLLLGWLQQGSGGSSLALAALALAISLFSKESSTGYAAVWALMLLVFARRQPAAALRAAAVLAAVVALYALARAGTGASQPVYGEARYHFHLGLNVLRNAALITLSTLLPVSSEWLSRAGGWPAALGALWAAAVAAWVAGGLALGRQARLGLLLFLIALASVSPMLVLNHVSELHAYTALPFVALLFGAAAAGWLSARGPLRSAAIAAAALVFLGNALAVQSKLTCMRHNAARSEALLRQIVPVLKQDVPRGGCLRLVNAPGNNYSVFRLRGFEVLGRGLHEINRRAGRPDADVAIIPPGAPPEDGCVMLGLRDGRVYRLR